MSGFYTPPNVRGEDKQIQYNENGVLSASSDLIWDDTEKELGVTGDAIISGFTTTQTLSVSGVSTFSSSVNLDGDLNISDVGIGTTFTTSLQIQTPTADRVVTIPDATGTLALISGNTGYVPYNDNGSNSSDSGFTFNSNTGLAVTTNVRAGVDTSRGIILTSPNGTEYLLFVDNSGVLGTTTSIV